MKGLWRCAALPTTWKGDVAPWFAEKMRLSLECSSDKKKKTTHFKCASFTDIRLVSWITMSRVCSAGLIRWPLRIDIFCWTNVCSSASALNKCLLMNVKLNERHIWECCLLRIRTSSLCHLNVPSSCHNNNKTFLFVRQKLSNPLAHEKQLC